LNPDNASDDVLWFENFMFCRAGNLATLQTTKPWCDQGFSADSGKHKTCNLQAIFWNSLHIDIMSYNLRKRMRQNALYIEREK